MALRSGCPVIGAFLVRQGLGRHRLVFSEEIPIRRTGNLRQDIADNTQRFQPADRVLRAGVSRPLVLAASAVEEAVGQPGV